MTYSDDNALDRLGRAVERVRVLAGTDTQVAWLCSVLATVLDGSAPSFEIAVGLRPGPGQRSLRNRCQLQERDAIYRRAWRRFYPDLKPAPAAHELHKMFERYETSSWPRDRGGAITCPPRLQGTIQALAWETLSQENPTLSAERIRKILVTS